MTWKGRERRILGVWEEARDINKVKVHQPASLGVVEGRIVLFRRHSI
jgi:hypothetical protein